ncbi:MAG: hypothetical protein KF884_07835 [Fimbriimonadaceae bacterium]|nr:hypothetical protein [Fimbriimonadaceae bacterium]QYK57460.1 MAG: hypothetical protein KF884_07835 [Fimbriimonadaceae bacterium]
MPPDFTDLRFNGKMANNGPYVTQLVTQSRWWESGNEYRAFYYAGATARIELAVPSGSTDSSARAATYRESQFTPGLIVGDSNATGSPIMPMLWTSNTSFQRYARQGFVYGTFLDVNTSAECAGFYEDNNGAREAVVRRTDNEIERLTDIGYVSSMATSINQQGWVGGQLFNGSDGSPATVWVKSGSTWNSPLKVSSSSDWTPFAGRSARVVGITDVKAGDTAGPYAVGWVEPTAGEGDPEALKGRAFILDTWAEIDPYVDNATRKVRARITATASGIVFAPTTQLSFEQLRLVVQ